MWTRLIGIESIAQLSQVSDYVRRLAFGLSGV